MVSAAMLLRTRGSTVVKHALMTQEGSAVVKHALMAQEGLQLRVLLWHKRACSC